MLIAVDADNKVVAWSTQFAVDVPQGCTGVELTTEQQAALIAIKPGIQVTFNGTTFVPLTASAGNFMRALIELGWFDAIDAAVNSLSGVQGKLARALWTRAVEFPREDPLIAQIATAVGMTAADIEAVYIKANTY